MKDKIRKILENNIHGEKQSFGDMYSPIVIDMEWLDIDRAVQELSDLIPVLDEEVVKQIFRRLNEHCPHTITSKHTIYKRDCHRCLAILEKEAICSHKPVKLERLEETEQQIAINDYMNKNGYLSIAELSEEQMIDIAIEAQLEKDRPILEKQGVEVE